MSETQTLEIDWSKRDEPDMRDRIVATYYSFAIASSKRAIRKFANKGVQLDLHAVESAALDGLLAAIPLFDVARKIKFTTYAGVRIRGAILDAARRSDPLSRRARKFSYRRERAMRDLAQQLGRTPTVDEVIAASGLTAEQIAESSMTLQSIDHELYRGDDNRSVSNHQLLGKPAQIGGLEEADSFREFCRGIDLESQTLLYLYYYRNARMKEIGQVLGLSESRISQMHSSLLSQFRKKLRKANEVNVG